MKKIIWVVIGIAIAIIFFPKDAGGVYGGLISIENPPNYIKIRSDCYGFFIEDIPDSTQCADCGINYICYGILGKKHCYNIDGEIPCSIAMGK